MCWQHENISCFKQLLTSQTLLTTFSLTSQVLSLHTGVILILIACRCKVDDLFIFSCGQLLPSPSVRWLAAGENHPISDSLSHSNLSTNLANF